MRFFSFLHVDPKLVARCCMTVLLLKVLTVYAVEETTESSINKETEEQAQEKTESSRSAPIEIEADAAEQNEAEGTITYRGNVIIKQNNITIHADSVIISSEKSNSDSARQLNRIVATGKPATFDHYVTEENQSVFAQAKSIIFQVKNKTIELSGSAQLNQSQSSVSGENITYDIEQRRVNAKSGGSDLETGKRVKTVISPDGKLLPSIR